MRLLWVRLRKQLRNPDNRNKLIVVGALGVLALVVLMLNTNWRELVPDLRNYSLRSQEYEELRTQLQREEAQLKTLQHNSVQRNEVWIFTKGEDSRLVIMQKLESTAAECGVNLRTSGNLKDVQIANGVLGYELDINADAAPLRNVCQFIIALSLSQPRFFWDNLTLKPSGGNVTLVGKLKVVVVTGNGALRNYWGDDA